MLASNRNAALAATTVDEIAQINVKELSFISQCSN